MVIFHGWGCSSLEFSSFSWCSISWCFALVSAKKGVKTPCHSSSVVVRQRASMRQDPCQWRNHWIKCTLTIKETVVMTTKLITWGKQTDVCSWADMLCRLLQWLYAKPTNLLNDLQQHNTRLHIRFQSHVMPSSMMTTDWCQQRP